MAFDAKKIFSKKLDELKLKGNYRTFNNVERHAGHYPAATLHPCDYAEQKITIWCSNDYLGMSQHPGVIAAMQKAAKSHGVGAGGTRNIAGTSNLHVELEDAVAKLHKRDAALIFTSAYVANQTTLVTLGRHVPDLVFVSDEANHASMIEGMRATKCDKLIFKHNDLNDLRLKLDSIDKNRPVMIVFESVYSMDGDIAPIQEICDIADEYGAMTYLDEVHGVGLYGDTGAGIAERDGVMHRPTIINGTFAKGFGVVGGYITADQTTIDFIRSYGAGFIFTTSLPPPTCAAVLKSIEIVSQDSSLREKHQANAEKLKKKLDAAGIAHRPTVSHIVPVMIGDPVKCKRVADLLLYGYGIYVQPINYPTVPWGQECLRLTPSPVHSEADMNQLIDALKDVLMQESVEFKPEKELMTA